MTRTVARFAALLAVALAGASTTLMTGCQTVKGVGQDIKNVGESGERAIDNR